MSWSIVDGDGVAKPAWYAVRRAFAPVMASFRETGNGSIELWVTNDTLADVAIVGFVRLVTLAGDTIEHVALDCTAVANASRIIWQGTPDAAANRVLIGRSPAFPDCRHFFAPLKDIPLQPKISIGVGHEEITISADRYSYGIGLFAQDPATRFSDNFFDLAAGESRKVSISGSCPAAITVLPGFKAKNKAIMYFTNPIG